MDNTRESNWKRKLIEIDEKISVLQGSRSRILAWIAQAREHAITTSSDERVVLLRACHRAGVLAAKCRKLLSESCAARNALLTQAHAAKDESKQRMSRYQMRTREHTYTHTHTLGCCLFCL